MNLESYRGKIFVIKYGGAAMADDELKSGFFEDMALLQSSGIRVVIVHGGGKEVTAISNKLGFETKFIDGQRYTDRDTIEVVQMVLAGKTNKDIVSALCAHGIPALGICGIDCNLLKVKKFEHNGQDLGLVGTVVSVNTRFLQTLFESGILPVIAPLGTDEKGIVHNINADNAVASIAQELHADKLMYVSDIVGVYARGGIVRSLNIEDAEQLIAETEINGGMIPKVRSAFNAMKNNVASVVLVNGKQKNPIISQLSGVNNAGTEFAL